MAPMCTVHTSTSPASEAFQPPSPSPALLLLLLLWPPPIICLSCFVFARRPEKEELGPTRIQCTHTHYIVRVPSFQVATI
ncbi:hypothetical protein LZ30DRAFT_359539 [Colletotrichum cereale]|nr:hypothetical protein LZ30DRAFT_359539 [Colletotrichum cereale]